MAAVARPANFKRRRCGSLPNRIDPHAPGPADARAHDGRSRSFERRVLQPCRGCGRRAQGISALASVMALPLVLGWAIQEDLPMKQLLIGLCAVLIGAV